MTSPYITPNELLAAPLGVTWPTIGSATSQTGPTQPANLAALATLCRQATESVDSECGQTLRGTIFQELQLAPGHRCGLLQNNDGRFMTSRSPVAKVVQVLVTYGGPQQTSSSGPAVFQWTTVPTGFSYPSEQEIGYGNLPSVATGGMNAITISGGFISYQAGRLGTRVQCTYVHGWPTAALTAAVNAGATSLPVDDVTLFNGITGSGATVLVSDPLTGLTETVVVTAVASAANVAGEPTGPGTLTIAAPGLVNAHAVGVIVTGMPEGVRWAAMLFAKANALQRGIAVYTVPRGAGGGGGGGGGAEAAIDDANKEASIELAVYKRPIGT